MLVFFRLLFIIRELFGPPAGISIAILKELSKKQACVNSGTSLAQYHQIIAVDQLVFFAIAELTTNLAGVVPFDHGGFFGAVIN